jgi:dihydrolipoamide dehydrogenase
MDYDLTIIGAGWAGFNAALKAKELGLNVCLIDKGDIGGTCLNRGCIPTKALIQSAKVYSLSKKCADFGIENSSPAANFAEIQKRKDKLIQQLRSGMQFMLKNIEFLNAEAKIISPDEIQAAGKNLQTKSILIASGSKPFELQALKFDGKKIVSSDDILNLKELPKSLLIVGGGVIGCEFASLFCSLGTQVTIVEMMPQILPGIDKEAARKLEGIYKKKGVKVYVNTDAATQDLNSFNLVLVAVGRTPNTRDLGLDKVGVNLEKNKIIVDKYLQTNIPNIYAAGDCTGKIMLAHFAAYQGEVVAENVARGQSKKANNATVPNCIFTDPEIASVGLSEEEAVSRGVDVKVSKFDFLASGMARILDEADGFIKVLSDKKTDVVIGGSIIGPKATELIANFSLAISCGLKCRQIKETIFAHPTLSESIREAIK